MRSEGGGRHWDHWARRKLSFTSGDRDFSRLATRCAAERCRAALIARHLVRLLAGTAYGAGNWPPGLRPNNKGKLSRSAAAPERRSGLENGRSSSVRAEAVRLRPLVPMVITRGRCPRSIANIVRARVATRDGTFTAPESLAQWACDLGKRLRCQSSGVHLGCRHAV